MQGVRTLCALLVVFRYGQSYGLSRDTREVRLFVCRGCFAARKATMAGTRGLSAAKRAKQDEFYTQLDDIAEEVRHYAGHFRGKVVLCNCDDPRVSNFFHYFSHNFERLGLKKLVATCYRSQARDLFSQNACGRAIWLEYAGDRNGNRVPDPEEIGIHALRGDGDEHHLQLRAFDGNTRREGYERPKGVCAICGKRFAFKEMEADHITPWAEGGRTAAENCQMLCRTCNRRKSDK